MNNQTEKVREVVVTTLGIKDRRDEIDEDTALLNGIPELDSMALVDLVVALEREFGITIEDEDITGETFETLGSLAAAVQSRAAASRSPWADDLH